MVAPLKAETRHVKSSAEAVRVHPWIDHGSDDIAVRGELPSQRIVDVLGPAGVQCHVSHSATQHGCVSDHGGLGGAERGQAVTELPGKQRQAVSQALPGHLWVQAWRHDVGVVGHEAGRQRAGNASRRVVHSHGPVSGPHRLGPPGRVRAVRWIRIS
jgi:hypothetical protein